MAFKLHQLYKYLFLQQHADPRQNTERLAKEIRRFFSKRIPQLDKMRKEPESSIQPNTMKYLRKLSAAFAQLNAPYLNNLLFDKKLMHLRENELETEALKEFQYKMPSDDEIEKYFKILENKYHILINDAQAMEKFKVLFKLTKFVADFIEDNNNAEDADPYFHAYKLLVYFNNNQATPSKLNALVANFDNYVTVNLPDDKKPVHNALVTNIPIAGIAAPLHMPDWRQMIAQKGKRAIEVFQQATQIESVIDREIQEEKERVESTIKHYSELEEKLEETRHRLNLIAKKLDQPEIEFPQQVLGDINNPYRKRYIKKEEKHKPQKLFIDYQMATVISATLTYKRAKEYPELASLCQHHHISENTFNKCLEVRAKIKKKDNLPEINFNGSSVNRPGYRLVKLPIDDPHAYILGHLSNSCQSIGGITERCVIDGIQRENNGFYVLLEEKIDREIKVQGERKVFKDGKIDYDHFEIVGQAYAWMSKAGNLVLDSWENRYPSRDDDVIVDILKNAGNALVHAKDSTIMRVTVGTGGQTPKEKFKAITEEKTVNEAMREGYHYGDSIHQFIVARNQNKQEKLITEITQAQKNLSTDPLLSNIIGQIDLSSLLWSQKGLNNVLNFFQWPELKKKLNAVNPEARPGFYKNLVQLSQTVTDIMPYANILEIACSAPENNRNWLTNNVMNLHDNGFDIQKATPLLLLVNQFYSNKDITKSAFARLASEDKVAIEQLIQLFNSPTFQAFWQDKTNEISLTKMLEYSSGLNTLMLLNGSGLEIKEIVDHFIDLNKKSNTLVQNYIDAIKELQKSGVCDVLTCRILKEKLEQAGYIPRSYLHGSSSQLNSIIQAVSEPFDILRSEPSAFTTENKKAIAAITDLKTRKLMAEAFVTIERSGMSAKAKESQVHIVIRHPEIADKIANTFSHFQGAPSKAQLTVEQVEEFYSSLYGASAPWSAERYFDAASMLGTLIDSDLSKDMNEHGMIDFVKPQPVDPYSIRKPRAYPIKIASEFIPETSTKPTAVIDALIPLLIKMKELGIYQENKNLILSDFANSVSLATIILQLKENGFYSKQNLQMILDHRNFELEDPYYCLHNCAKCWKQLMDIGLFPRCQELVLTGVSDWYGRITPKNIADALSYMKDKGLADDQNISEAPNLQYTRNAWHIMDAWAIFKKADAEMGTHLYSQYRETVLKNNWGMRTAEIAQAMVDLIRLKLDDERNLKALFQVKSHVDAFANNHASFVRTLQVLKSGGEKIYEELWEAACTPDQYGNYSDIAAKNLLFLKQYGWYDDVTKLVPLQSYWGEWTHKEELSAALQELKTHGIYEKAAKILLDRGSASLTQIQTLTQALIILKDHPILDTNPTLFSYHSNQSVDLANATLKLTAENLLDPLVIKALALNAEHATELTANIIKLHQKGWYEENRQTLLVDTFNPNDNCVALLEMGPRVFQDYMSLLKKDKSIAAVELKSLLHKLTEKNTYDNGIKLLESHPKEINRFLAALNGKGECPQALNTLYLDVQSQPRAVAPIVPAVTEMKLDIKENPVEVKPTTLEVKEQSREESLIEKRDKLLKQISKSWDANISEILENLDTSTLQQMVSKTLYGNGNAFNQNPIVYFLQRIPSPYEFTEEKGEKNKLNFSTCFNVLFKKIEPQLNDNINSIDDINSLLSTLDHGQGDQPVKKSFYVIHALPLEIINKLVQQAGGFEKFEKLIKSTQMKGEFQSHWLIVLNRLRFEQRSNVANKYGNVYSQLFSRTSNTKEMELCAYRSIILALTHGFDDKHLEEVSVYVNTLKNLGILPEVQPYMDKKPGTK